MSVSCECCVLSGIGLCDELITRPEESCVIEELKERGDPDLRLAAAPQKNRFHYIIIIIIKIITM
jgi:hypothetical protein